MDRWQNKVALVTGASEGIGREIAAELVRCGMLVYGCARTMAKLEEVQRSLEGQRGKFYPVQCDLSNETSILDMFATIEKVHGGLHVLINNAGVLKNSTLLDAPTSDWREMLDVFVLAPAITTREAVRSMRKHGIDDGHIINISAVGAYMMPPVPFLHFPCAAKCALLAMTKGVRHELLAANSGIRVSTLSPGAVETDIIQKMTAEGGQGKLDAHRGMKSMKVTDITSAVKFVLSADPGCNVFDVLMHPTGGF